MRTAYDDLKGVAQLLTASSVARFAGRAGLLRQHAAGALVFILCLGLTTGALGVLHGLDATPSRALELGVLIAASLAATVTRYVALRSWVFARRHAWVASSA